MTPTDLSEILRKFFAEVKTEKGQALTPSVLTGIRAAIHRHLTCAPLSRNINILQDSEFISANKGAKAKLFTKHCETKTQIIYSVRRYAEIESILHGRAEQGRRLEMWRSWLSLFGFRCVFILLAVAERDGGSLQGSHLKQKMMTLEPVTYVRFDLVY